MSEVDGSDEDEARLRDYRTELVRRFPGLVFVHKDQDRLSRWIDRALRLITFGGQCHYLDRYVTTLGRRIYLPRGWEARTPRARYIVLRHEAVHLAQFARYGLLGMSLLYGLPLLPLGLAWGRARLEWEAYAETLRVTAALEGLAAAEASRHHICAQFTGPAYGWMWPFPRVVNRWIDEELDRIRASSSSS